MLDKTLFRYISNEEYKSLIKDKYVIPINAGRAWDNKKRIFAFPLSMGTEEEYSLVKEYLEVAYDIDYQYKVYIKPRLILTPTMGVYDVEMVHMTLGKPLVFEIDEDIYDTGPVYLVPEVRLFEYSLEEVEKIVDLKTDEVVYIKSDGLKESTKIDEISATFYYDLDKHNIYYVQDLANSWRDPEQWYVNWLDKVMTEYTDPDWFSDEEGFLPRFHWEMGEFLAATSNLRSKNGFYGRIYTHAHKGYINGHDSGPIEIEDTVIPQETSIELFFNKIYNTFRKEFSNGRFQPVMEINLFTDEGVKYYEVEGGRVKVEATNNGGQEVKEETKQILKEDKYDHKQILDDWGKIFKGTARGTIYANLCIYVYLDKNSTFPEKIKPYLSEEDYKKMMDYIESKKVNNQMIDIIFPMDKASDIINKAKAAGAIKEAKVKRLKESQEYFKVYEDYTLTGTNFHILTKNDLSRHYNLEEPELTIAFDHLMEYSRKYGNITEGDLELIFFNTPIEKRPWNETTQAADAGVNSKIDYPQKKKTKKRGKRK